MRLDHGLSTSFNPKDDLVIKEDGSVDLAWTQPASQEAVEAILAADPGLEAGFTRSEWLWIRLANGDLILGVFPQDEAYFAFETEHS